MNNSLTLSYQKVCHIHIRFASSEKIGLNEEQMRVSSISEERTYCTVSESEIIRRRISNNHAVQLNVVKSKIKIGKSSPSFPC